MAFVLRSASSISMAKAKPVVKTQNARLSVVSRAADKEPTPASTPAPEAVKPAPPTPPPASKAVSVGDVMNFGGAAPEITNGRLVMLGFIAALGAELSSGESVLAQLGDAPMLIPATFMLFIAASIIPITKNLKPEAFGPLTPNAVLINGRAAMIGFAALLAFEATNGAALF
eukprot:gene25159-biopygen19631